MSPSCARGERRVGVERLRGGGRQGAARAQNFPELPFFKVPPPPQTIALTPTALRAASSTSRSRHSSDRVPSSSHIRRRSCFPVGFDCLCFIGCSKRSIGRDVSPTSLVERQARLGHGAVIGFRDVGYLGAGALPPGRHGRQTAHVRRRSTPPSLSNFARADRPRWSVDRSNKSATKGYKEVIFKEYADASVGRRMVSLFPGLGYAAGYKVLQRVYKSALPSSLLSSTVRLNRSHTGSVASRSSKTFSTRGTSSRSSGRSGRRTERG